MQVTHVSPRSVVAGIPRLSYLRPLPPAPPPWLTRCGIADPPQFRRAAVQYVCGSGPGSSIVSVVEDGLCRCVHGVPGVLLGLGHGPGYSHPPHTPL